MTREEFEQIIENHHDGLTSQATLGEFLDALTEHGYVIAHPDDVDEVPRKGRSPWQRGFVACRARIFNDAV